MRSFQFSCLALPALVAAAPPLHAPLPLEVITSMAAMPSPTPMPTSNSYHEISQEGEINELKREVAATTTTSAASQMGTVTTEWVESTNSITTTWVEMIYTQTFASVPDQWHTSGSGSIGLGTITGKVGVVKDSKSGASAILPSGTFMTVALGIVGIVTGAGMVFL